MITSSIGNQQYKVTHGNGRHTFFADEPIDKGGKGVASTPDELLEAALASCTLITLRMYTDHKKWDIGEVHIVVLLERTDGKSIITRKLNFEKAITYEQQQRLVQVAKNCPVSKTLSGSSELIIEIG